MSEIRGDIEQAKNLNDTQTTGYPETALVNKKLEWFKDQKLGVIFHWGLYAEAGIVESWQLSEQDEWAREPKAWRDDIKTLQKDYWNLIEDFNPVNFDPVKWAKVCKDAGYKYMIFTTKHHDGFHMWNTAQSDFKIGGSRSPFKRDIFKEVAEAFRAEGLGIGVYYSKADWYSPYYWSDKENKVQGRRADYIPAENPELWGKYVDFVHAELEELTQNYGPVDILWLDAGWCGMGKEDLKMDEIAEKVRKTNPDLLIVDRMMGGRHENYVTPERKIPDVAEIPNKPWESNIPYGFDWGFTHTDKYKTSRELLINVIDVTSKGGNIILGFGPTAKGDFTQGQLDISADLGKWLSANGEGIYGTRALDYQVDNRAFFVTQKDTNLYVFYPYAGEGINTLSLPKEVIEKHQPKKITLLETGEAVTFTDEGDRYVLTLPTDKHSMSIVSLKMER